MIIALSNVWCNYYSIYHKILLHISEIPFFNRLHQAVKKRFVTSPQPQHLLRMVPEQVISPAQQPC